MDGIHPSVLRIGVRHLYLGLICPMLLMCGLLQQYRLLLRGPVVSFVCERQQFRPEYSYSTSFLKLTLFIILLLFNIVIILLLYFDVAVYGIL